MKKLSKKDYYYNEQGLMVFTSYYHIRRGYCCKSLCKHCPYGMKNKKKELKRKSSNEN